MSFDFEIGDLVRAERGDAMVQGVIYEGAGGFLQIDDAISRSLREARESLMSRKEAHLLEFFGSMEVAKRRVKFYILEQYPAELEHSGDVYTVKEKFRLRLKTAEELLEENTSE